jgi:hypothetical protein
LPAAVARPARRTSISTFRPAVQPLALAPAATPRYDTKRSTGLSCACGSSTPIAAHALALLRACRERPRGCRAAEQRVGRWGVCGAEHADAPHALSLLRARCQRPCSRRAADEREEVGPFHSITPSARASSVGGSSRPSALAVFRLMTRSNLVGCSTGMSPGFAPRKILSTKTAARRYRSGKFGP